MKIVKTVGALALAVALMAPAAASAQNRSPLQIVVYNMKKAVGTIRVAVCTIQTFLKECPYEGEAPATMPTTTVTVNNLPPGTYAAQVFQDVNDNHKVDRNPLGIPKEGVGFSNDAMIFVPILIWCGLSQPMLMAAAVITPLAAAGVAIAGLRKAVNSG